MSREENIKKLKSEIQDAKSWLRTVRDNLKRSPENSIERFVYNNMLTEAKNDVREMQNELSKLTTQQ